jgi:hypothetical protein
VQLCNFHEAAAMDKHFSFLVCFAYNLHKLWNMQLLLFAVPSSLGFSHAKRGLFSLMVELGEFYLPYMVLESNLSNCRI